MKLTFLGTGTSHGIPVIGCSCRVCKSNNPKNNRYRCAFWIQTQNTSIVIDTPTEFRLQALKYNIDKIDAVLYTHFHADHVHGIDDLRRYNELQKKSIICYGSDETIKGILRQHDYINKYKKEGGGVPALELIPIDNNILINDIEVIPIEIFHGSLPVLGFRIENTAYLTDCNKIPEKSYEKLKDLDVLVLDALRFRRHSTHFTIEQAIIEAEKIGAKKTYLTHLCHDIDHDLVGKNLPHNCYLAYDGLVLS